MTTTLETILACLILALILAPLLWLVAGPWQQWCDKLDEREKP